MTDVQEYDLIAIGAGPAGESATELASYFGYRTLIIEQNKPGGVVTTTGGVPTKTLREAALYLSGFREGDLYGMRLQAAPEFAIAAIKKRTLAVCDLLQKATLENIQRRGVDYLQGVAQLASDKTVKVSTSDGAERTFKAKKILIATGSRPAKPTGANIAHPGICDTDTILNRGRPPKSLLIVGGGAVAIEFATIMRALDIPVRIVDRGSRLASMMDEEISARLGKLFAQWDVKVSPNTTIETIDPVGDELEVLLTNGEKFRTDTILYAAGRVANTEHLGLENLGIEVDSRGRIQVNENLETNAAGVYAGGDVVHPTLASIAMEQGRAITCHAFDIPFNEVVDPTPVSAIYGMPEVAGAGLTEQECHEKNVNYEVGYCELAATPRGAIAGRDGLLKLIFSSENRKLLGVHCIGDIASEIVGIGQMAIRCGGTIHTIATMSMNTPTYSYAYKYAALDGLQRLKNKKEKFL